VFLALKTAVLRKQASLNLADVVRPAHYISELVPVAIADHQRPKAQIALPYR
jgi:hypothetical protein